MLEQKPTLAESPLVSATPVTVRVHGPDVWPSGLVQARTLRVLAERAWGGRVMRATDIAEYTGQPLAEVERGIKQLERAGVIEVNHRIGGSPWWTVVDREAYPEHRHDLY